MCKSLLMISDDCRSLQGMKVQSRLRLCSWSPAKCSAADFHAWVNASTHCGTRSDSETVLLCCCLFVLLCCNHNTGTETNLVTLLWFLVSNSAKDAGTSLAQWKYVTGCHCKVFFSAVTLLVGQWEQYLACNKPLLVLKPGQSLCLWLGNWTLLTHDLCKILWIPYTRHVANTKSGRLPAVLQFPTLLKRDGSAPKQDHYRVIVMSLRPSSCWSRPCGRPHTTGCGGLILMYSQSTSGSTQPGERPVTACSGDISSTWQHSFMGKPLEKKNKPCFSNPIDLPLEYLEENGNLGWWKKQTLDVLVVNIV